MSTPYYRKVRRHLSRKCPVMKTLITRVGPCTLEVKPDDPFTLLVGCVISQQISTKAARSIFGKLAAAVDGPPVALDRIARMTARQYKACGVSGPKQRTLRAVVAHVRANPDLLPGIAERDDGVIREQLTAITGIGPWTVDMLLMFSIGRPDILPATDFGLRAAVRNEFGLAEMPKPADVQRLAEPWRPYRSIATWYMWRSLGPVPQSGDDE